jgi:tetratricopeptide (TPR) repeat protein
MLLDILGTNCFERPIYVMNPRYLTKVFPDIQKYIRQEGIVYRIVPYPADGRFDYNKTSKLFLDKFQWGGVKDEGVYLEEAVTINNSRSMRNNFSLYANKLINNGHKAEAVKILDKSLIEFPSSKIPFDRYDIMLAEAYLKAGAMDKGQGVLNELISYYVSYVKYLEQFKGKKAKAVEGEITLAIYVLSELASLAENYNLKAELDLAKSIPMVSEIMETYKVRDLMNEYAVKLNQVNSMVNVDKAQAEAVLLEVIEGLNTQILSTGNNTLIEQSAQYFGFIYNIAYRNSLLKVQEALTKNPKIQEVLNTLMAQQQ